MSKVAFITGAAQGIGAGIAERLAKDGFDIAIADLPFQKEKAAEVINKVEENGHKGIFLELDVTNQQAFVDAVDKAVDELGDLNVLVNNAGVAKVDSVVDIKPEDLELSFKINVFGVVYGMQAAAKKFKALGHPGKIINASSIAGLKAFPVWGTYSASKFAVVGFTEAAAAELAPDHITVNAYAPGVVGTTGMWDDIDAKMSKLNGKPLGQNKQDFIDQIPLGRTVLPSDVVNLVAFLSGPDSDYMTGNAIRVDGGMK